MHSDERNEQEIAEDILRVIKLQALGIDSPAAVDYAIDLRKFGLGELLKLHNEKRLHSQVRRLFHGAQLYRPPRHWDFPPLESLIFFSVYDAIEPFMRRAIMDGQWEPKYENTLRAYFVIKSCQRYLDEYRKAYALAQRSSRELFVDFTINFELDVIHWWQTTAVNLEEVAVSRAVIREILNRPTHRNIPEIVFRISCEWTYKEIAERLETTEQAVGTALSRFRQDVNQRRKAGDKR